MRAKKDLIFTREYMKFSKNKKRYVYVHIRKRVFFVVLLLLKIYQKSFRQLIESAIKKNKNEKKTRQQKRIPID